MELPKRKLPRLRDYDYATPGAYFVTICSNNKQCIFGKVTSAEMVSEAFVQYSPIGEIAKECLLDIASHYENIRINQWVIMPNHIHILISIEECGVQKAYDISNVIGKYKAAVTRAVGNAFMHSGKIWQSSFYDHIVRDEHDYQQIWNYISGNPSKWGEDCFYCE